MPKRRADAERNRAKILGTAHAAFAEPDSQIAAEAVDLADIAAITSKLADRPIRRVVVGDDEHRAGLVAQGLPEVRVDMAMGIFQASRLGQFARVDTALARLVNRPPTPLRDVLRASLPE